jgi:hypothetical protein
MASAPASAALSTAADNGAAKPAEKQQPVQVGAPHSDFASVSLPPVLWLRFQLAGSVRAALCGC